ncbi:hypothetical protein RYX36_033775, partial [Vicia faba]
LTETWFKPQPSNLQPTSGHAISATMLTSELTAPFTKVCLTNSTMSVLVVFGTSPNVPSVLKSTN